MSSQVEAWDIFESESLSVRRAQSPSAIREALTAGSLTEDDLARPAGSSTPWRRLGDILPEWSAPAAPARRRERVTKTMGKTPGNGEGVPLLFPHELFSGRR